MLVSVITVSLNSEKTISDTIRSVLNQTYSEIEYIIIDGKSTDRTLQIAESFRRQFEEKNIIFKVCSEPDNGIYDAMNKGISYASGEIVGMINSDDWYEPIAVERAVKAYEREKYDWYFADLNVVKPDGRIVVKHSKTSKFLTTRNWNHPTSFVSKRLYERMQYACNTIYDDYDLFLRANKEGYKILNENVVLANYRFGGTSSKRSLKRVKNCISYRYRNYRRNGYSRFYIFESVIMEIAKYFLG